MKIFKFGGASVKNAKSIKNVVRVLKNEGLNNKLVVISAMGKMTNAFEKIVNSYCDKKEDLPEKILDVREFHDTILNDLFPKKLHPIFTIVEEIFAQMSGFMAQNTSKDYNYIYDQIVSNGEFLSTHIVSAYLTEIEIENTWIDVRDYIKTDRSYRDAHVDWEQTKEIISNEIDLHELTITQGFLGGNEGKTTTLGREGSDYTAAIFAYCLNAESVTIWKDVDGVLNADPRHFQDTILLNEISYEEAIELAFYGASVIHPKTLKPLENKLIPLQVRSFLNLENKGTIVKKGIDILPRVPCCILKKNQVFISISALDFSFMVEHNLSDVFKELHKYRLKVNLIQNSALSFSVCVEDNFNNFNTFLKDVKAKYKVTYNEGVTLFTIRHFDSKAISEIEKKHKVLLKQISTETIQIVVE
ncbi:MAG: aspartate kinase [Urechidicola sp.]|jgi:aspartate kinase